VKAELEQLKQSEAKLREQLDAKEAEFVKMGESLASQAQSKAMIQMELMTLKGEMAMMGK
jgi:hypothetical protein